jgi:hypothetical protein
MPPRKAAKVEQQEERVQRAKTFYQTVGTQQVNGTLVDHVRRTVTKVTATTSTAPLDSGKTLTSTAAHEKSVSMLLLLETVPDSLPLFPNTLAELPERLHADSQPFHAVFNLFVHFHGVRPEPHVVLRSARVGLIAVPRRLLHSGL